MGFFSRALIRKSIADITRRRGRSVLVILGIFISVCGLVAINTANASLASAFDFSQTHVETPEIQVTANLPMDVVVPAIKAMPGVRYAVATVTLPSQPRWRASVAPGYFPINILVLPDYQRLPQKPCELSSGQYPGAGEILLESGDRALQPVSLGETITLDGLLIDGHARSGQVRVSGFCRTPGLNSPATSGVAQGYMSIAGATQLVGAQNQGHLLLVKVTDGASNGGSIGQIADQVDQMLKARGIMHTTVLNPPLLDQPRQLVNGVALLTSLLAIVGLLLTSFLMINTITTLLTEQTRVIGTMKALGGSRRQIMLSYLLSVAVYGCLGTLFGIPLGIAAGAWFSSWVASMLTLDVGSSQFVLSPVLEVSLVGIGIPLLTALWPLTRGTRITVREALSGYGISSPVQRSGRGFLGRFLSWLPLAPGLGIRTAFRKRLPSSLTLASLILAATAFLAIQIATVAVNQQIARIDQNQHYQVWARVQPEPLPKLKAALRFVPNIKRIEGVGGYAFTTHWGVLHVDAVQVDTTMYDHQLLAGRWLSENETGGIVLSNEVMQTTGLHIGDALTITYYTGNSGQKASVSWRVVGEIHESGANPGQIGTGVITLATAAQINGTASDVVDVMTIQAVNTEPAAVDTLVRNVNNALALHNWNINIASQTQIVARDQSGFQPIAIIFYVFTALVGLVGILGLAHTLTNAVLERRREIGLWRSMGATSGQVGLIFWIEGLTFALLAWVIGLLLGLPLADAFLKLISRILFLVTFTINALALAETLGLVMLLASLASLGPALSASRLRINEALRYE